MSRLPVLPRAIALFLVIAGLGILLVWTIFSGLGDDEARERRDMDAAYKELRKQ